MTVLPTVRRQLQHAAERQATGAAARTRTRTRLSALRGGRVRSRRRPARGSARRHGPRSAGGVVVALGVLVAVAVAVSAVALLAHKRTAATLPAAIPAVDRYRFTGHGIGDIAFGDRPAAVAAGLERLLGPPATASATSRIGYVRSICGFDHEIDWSGLAARPNGSNSDGLTVYFKRSRFVGYSYGPPYGGPHAPAVRRGPMLHTARGLGLGDKLTRGQQLYGRAFIVTSQPRGTPPSKRLERLPSWDVHAASGRIYGFIDSSGGPNSTRQQTIGSISAGAIPNTPCRS